MSYFSHFPLTTITSDVGTRSWTRNLQLFLVLQMYACVSIYSCWYFDWLHFAKANQPDAGL
ncbi:hypothetical protein L195_g060546, partial [Trifolium pratense]